MHDNLQVGWCYLQLCFCRKHYSVFIPRYAAARYITAFVFKEFLSQELNSTSAITRRPASVLATNIAVKILKEGDARIHYV